MSSFNRRTVMLMAMALAGCGFTPAFAPDGAGAKLLGRVILDAPDDKHAYQFVRRVEERLGRANHAKYGLSFDLSLREQAMAITSDDRTTRFDVMGRVTYALRDLDSKAVITSGSVDNFTGYSTTGSTVASFAARRDAYERLMVILADQMIARLISSPDLAG